jgi:hypothetical protein
VFVDVSEALDRPVMVRSTRHGQLPDTGRTTAASS